MEKCCRTCRFYIFEGITYGYVCCNNKSEYCADWVEGRQSCKEYEPKEKEEVIESNAFLGSKNGFFRELGIGIIEALLLEGNKAAFIEDKFQGVVAYSAADKIFYGKVQGLDENLVFFGETIEDAYNDFIRVINKYQEIN